MRLSQQAWLLLPNSTNYTCSCRNQSSYHKLPTSQAHARGLLVNSSISSNRWLLPCVAITPHLSTANHRATPSRREVSHSLARKVIL